jgi:hypothetical protein
MPPYDANLFDPPAPLASVTLRNPGTNLMSPDVPMLLDTGADVTLIPSATLDQLKIGSVKNKSYQLIGFDGSTSFAPMVQLELIFCRRIFRGQFLLIDQAWGILGRNVLNAVALMLDGPNHTWDEKHSPNA